MHNRAEIVIRQADHDRTLDIGMRRQGPLHFGRENIGTARHDHVGAAIGDVEIAVRVEPAEISQRLVTVCGAAALRADISVGRALTARRHGEDLPDFAGR